MSLGKHVSSVSVTCFYHFRQLRRIRRSFDADSAATLVHAFVTSRVDYCKAILAAAPKTTTDRLQRVLNAAARVVNDTKKFDYRSATITTDAPGVTLAGHSRACKLQAESADPPVSTRQGANVPIKLLHSSQSSSYTAESTFRCTSSADRNSTRHRLSTYGRRAFAVAGPTMFSTLPDDLRDSAVKHIHGPPSDNR